MFELAFVLLNARANFFHVCRTIFLRWSSDNLAANSSNLILIFDGMRPMDLQVLYGFVPNGKPHETNPTIV